MSRALAFSLLAFGLALLVTTCYEPSVLVSAFGLDRVASEATVVVGDLVIACFCGFHGLAHLTSRRGAPRE